MVAVLTTKKLKIKKETKEENTKDNRERDSVSLPCVAQSLGSDDGAVVARGDPRDPIESNRLNEA